MSYRTLRRQQIQLASKEIRCPECMKQMTLGEFQDAHARSDHGWEPLSCLYCFGRYKWQRGATKRKCHATHCLQCLDSFLEKYAVLPSLVPRQSLQANRTLVCLECKNFRPNPRDMRGRERLSEYVGLYDVSEFHRPEWWSSASVDLFDESKGLHNDVTGIFSRFQDGTLRWFHLMVKHDAYDTFRREMLEIRSHIAILPYSCLCDGLTRERVTHRHMILACELEFDFLKVWRKKVRYDRETGERAKYSVEIKNLFHLANVIQYVSQHKSSCDGKLIRDEVDETNARDYSHFMLDRHLSSHAIAWMSVLIPDGVEELLRTKNKNKNVVDWVQVVVPTRPGWAVEVRYTDFEYLYCVLPLRRDLERTDEWQELRVTWSENDTTFYKENPDLTNLTNDQWYDYHFETDNTFFRIRSKLYELGKRQRNVMSQMRACVSQMKRKWKNEEKERHELLEKRLRRENHENRKEFEREKRAILKELEEEKRLRAEIELAKRELEQKIAMQTEFEERLRKARDAIKREFERERDEFEERLQKANEATKREFEREKNKLKRDFERENDGLKKEMEELRAALWESKYFAR